MALEDTVATFNGLASQNVNLPQQMYAAAQGHVALVTAAYVNRIATFTTVFYVNAVTGSDLNAGTLVSPFASIQKAVDATPNGGSCLILLQSDYTLNAHVQVQRRNVVIKSASGTLHNFNFVGFTYTAGVLYRDLYGFAMSPGGEITFSGLTINLPAITGDLIGANESNSGVLRIFDDGGSWPTLKLTVRNCRWRIPGSPASRILPSGGTAILQWYSNTLDGVVTNLNGQVINDATNTAGTAVSTRRDILTNLATI